MRRFRYRFRLLTKTGSELSSPVKFKMPGNVRYLCPDQQAILRYGWILCSVMVTGPACVALKRFFYEQNVGVLQIEHSFRRTGRSGQKATASARNGDKRVPGDRCPGIRRLSVHERFQRNYRSELRCCDRRSGWRYHPSHRVDWRHLPARPFADCHGGVRQ
jgi:hypothetical protein